MNILSAFRSLLGFGRRITPSNRINNELLYLYSAAAPVRRNTEYRHIANALTSPASIMRRFIITNIILTFLACNSKTDPKQTERQQIPFQESGLKIACTRAIKTLDNEIHDIHYIDKSGKQIDKDSINKLLYSISLLDNFNQHNSTKYATNENEIYEKVDKKDKAYRLLTTSFLMENPGNLPVDNPIKTQIVLQDFDLFINDSSTQPISIRMLNDYDVIKIKIDGREINRLSESIPVGLEKVIYKLDSLKNKHNASR